MYHRNVPYSCYDNDGDDDDGYYYYHYCYYYYCTVVLYMLAAIPAAAFRLRGCSACVAVDWALNIN